MKNILLILFLIISLVSFLAPNLRADEASAYSEVARLRKYAGGADESDLKVQLKLSLTPSQKKKLNAPDEPSEGF